MTRTSLPRAAKCGSAERMMGESMSNNALIAYGAGPSTVWMSDGDIHCRTLANEISVGSED